MSQEMLDAVPKKQFAFIGAIEAASQVLGFIGAAQLPGTCLWLESVGLGTGTGSAVAPAEDLVVQDSHFVLHISLHNKSYKPTAGTHQRPAAHNAWSPWQPREC